MFNKKSSRKPSRKTQRKAQSAAPSLEQLIGVRIEYIHATPDDGRGAIVAIGMIDAYEFRGSEFFIHIQPDKGHLVPRWLHESVFIRYIHEDSVAIA
jgi:hypothetical protein